jgi:dihydropteroate synthase
VSTPATHWRIGPDRTLDLSEPHIMGILNVTPDSFSDGGRFESIDDACGQAAVMIDAGASIIDVGGESTRPGAQRVQAQVQIDRVVPVIEAIGEQWDIPLSIDTTLAEVARAAIDAGANIINDVAAGSEDAAMLPLAAQTGCGLVLMHRVHAPEDDSWSTQWKTPPQYGGDVAIEVRDWLLDRVAKACTAGVDRACICIDPGLGFGKDVGQNWRLIAQSHVLADTGLPVLGAASRKSFIGAVTGADQPEDRLPGSLAVTAVQCGGGFRLFRVHDVADHLRVARSVIAAAWA